jgi:2-(1,2-epoxy-1,2-dihydrophenyl)acetyl-CoA isomerase
MGAKRTRDDRPDDTVNPVRYALRGRVAVITHDRPEQRNAWSVDSVRATVAGIQRANTDDDVGAIVLTGAGNTYCAGADLKAEPQYDPDTGRRLTPAAFTMGPGDDNWITLLAQSKPVIVAVNGPATGIGATHTLAADIRVAASSASFSFPFLELGAMPECGSTALLPRLVGAGRAMDLILRAATLTAMEALDIGLVTAIYPDEALLERAVDLAEHIACLPALQVKLTKRMFGANACAQDADTVMHNESQAFVEMLKTLKREKPL